uniref:Uncharacterized protein n=1 Tax=Anguilla anguilla TaxID=7936 RepID=A0A0E9V472_ANGAN
MVNQSAIKTRWIVSSSQTHCRPILTPTETPLQLFHHFLNTHFTHTS